VEITALRTWKQLSEKNNESIDGSSSGSSSSSSSNSIQAWYDSMFKKARHSIYIEDQFLFQDKAITRILINRLREERNLKIITRSQISQVLFLVLYQKKVLTILIII
jgi:phosphatidylserine/phosphatidylglycerophosphate/cardiolipin synthase-like enzyme